MAAARRILIADNSPLFRQGVKQLLFAQGCQAVVLEASSLAEMQRFVAFYGQQVRFGSRGIDLIIADRCLKGLERFSQLLDAPTSHRPRVLLMAEVTDADFVSRATKTGIEGVINKDAPHDRFFNAVHSVAKGVQWYPQRVDLKGDSTPQSPLSSKQSLVFSRLRDGMSNKQIAGDLQISENTVKYHISQIYRKTGWDSPNRVKLASAKLEHFVAIG